MKENGSVLGMYQNQKGTLRADKYQAYANYITKFIQEYASRGIDIYAVTPNNEPDHASYDWPALPMSHTEAQNLVANYLRPTFDRKVSTPKLSAGIIAILRPITRTDRIPSNIIRMRMRWLRPMALHGTGMRATKKSCP